MARTLNYVEFADYIDNELKPYMYQLATLKETAFNPLIDVNPDDITDYDSVKCGIHYILEGAIGTFDKFYEKFIRVQPTEKA